MPFMQAVVQTHTCRRRDGSDPHGEVDGAELVLRLQEELVGRVGGQPAGGQDRVQSPVHLLCVSGDAGWLRERLLSEGTG